LFSFDFALWRFFDIYWFHAAFFAISTLPPRLLRFPARLSRGITIRPPAATPAPAAAFANNAALQFALLRASMFRRFAGCCRLFSHFQRARLSERFAFRQIFFIEIFTP